MSWTRRQFLEMVGMLGGSVAVHESDDGDGWMKTEAWEGRRGSSRIGTRRSAF
jgi:hypothetical protein